MIVFILNNDTGCEDAPIVNVGVNSAFLFTTDHTLKKLMTGYRKIFNLPTAIVYMHFH
jgi:hypothetical protein